ncbi:hypothetical protein [Roseobacter sp. S98]|uniref:hypothetical protein n=1 Tax=Roseobacter algicola (ex Choi et al. 2025) (nom. illeg.) TaxID=3092138 RepID=UPI0035C722D4
MVKKINNKSDCFAAILDELPQLSENTQKIESIEKIQFWLAAAGTMAGKSSDCSGDLRQFPGTICQIVARIGAFSERYRGDEPAVVCFFCMRAAAV